MPMNLSGGGRLLWLALAVVLAVLLAGCAGPRLVESQVSSYSSLSALPSPPTYRFERLPSQQAQAQSFAAIEALAEAALAEVGLRRDDAAPRLLAQISAEGGYARPRDWPYGGPDPFFARWHGRWGWHRGGMMGWMMDAPPTLHHRKVTLLLRDAASQQLVYETSALYEDVWTQGRPFGVLFRQALSGFPQPPTQPRQVRTEVLPQALP